MTGKQQGSANEKNQPEKKLTKGKIVENQKTVVQQKITRPKELILLFWVNERDKASIRYTGKALFSESAQTRLQNIKKSSWYNEKIHKVHSAPIQAVHEIGHIVQNWVSHYGGKDKIKTREIGVFSHSGHDGPITYQEDVVPPVISEWPHQMAIAGWKTIDFNWKSSGAICVFYGCQSGANTPSGFAIRLSVLENFSNVKVWGQSTYSYPSFYPDYRVTTYARSASLPVSWDVGATYMVGGNSGEGKKAVRGAEGGVLDLDPEELEFYPIANPMNEYKVGVVTQSTHQGVFNDHRKNS